MIMTMAATATVTKNMTTNMATFFTHVQKDNFYCLLKMIKKGFKNSIYTSSLQTRCFLITQPTKLIGSTLYY